MTHSELSALMKSVGGVIRDYVDPLSKRIEALEKAAEEHKTAPCRQEEVQAIQSELDPEELTAKVMPLIEAALAEIPPAPSGRDGEKGEKGDPGESIKGEKGDPGESIAGPAGPEGPAGPSGPPGRDGVDGKDGESIVGPRGERGIDGKDGRDGRDGTDGRDGKDGRDGEAGRDALELEILPAIDTQKSYRRGAFAKYEGGIVRAMRDTGTLDGETLSAAGWDVVVQGVHYIRVVQSDEDPRVFSVETALTGGEARIERFAVPMMIQRGVYKAGETYVRGDVVTWGGSQWHCNAAETASPPGESNSDWQLIVKRGRDGKSGKDAG